MPCNLSIKLSIAFGATASAKSRLMSAMFSLKFAVGFGWLVTFGTHIGQLNHVSRRNRHIGVRVTQRVQDYVRITPTSSFSARTERRHACRPRAVLHQYDQLSRPSSGDIRQADACDCLALQGALR